MNEELKDKILQFQIVGNIKMLKLRSKPESKYFDLVKSIIEATGFLPVETPIGHRLYYIRNDLTSIKLCACGCGNPVINPRNISFNGHAHNMEAVKKARQETVLKKYGVEFSSQLQSSKDKMKQTCIERYGVEWISQNVEIKNKIKQTCIEKFGVESAPKSQQCKDKMKQTCIERYGVDTVAKVAEFNQKKINTCLERYGTEYNTQSKEFLDSFKRTCLKKYGVEFAAQVAELYKKGRENRRIAFYNDLVNGNRLENKVKPLFTLEEFTISPLKYKFECCKCGSVFESTLDNGKTPRCFICYPRLIGGRSGIEVNMLDYIKSIYFGKIIEGDRNILNGLELDIYLPEEKLAIEVNGNYWHSELNGKDLNYHLNKTVECQKQNITLIHLFEDELIDYQEIVYSYIKNILHLNSYKINSADCIIKSIDQVICSKFLNKYHIQGNSPSDFMFGAFYKNRLVAAIALNPLNNKFYINRFTTINNFQISGILNHMIDYFVCEFGADKILYPINKRWLSADLWQHGEFILKTETPPNCWYLNDSNYKSRLSKKELVLEDKIEGLSEWENIQMNGYDRIWDCGTAIYIKRF